MSSIEGKIIGDKEKIEEMISKIHIDDLKLIDEYSNQYGTPILTAPSNRLKIHYRIHSFDCLGKYMFVEKEEYFTGVPNKSKIDFYFHLG